MVPTLGWSGIMKWVSGDSVEGPYVDFRQFWLQKSEVEFRKVCNRISKRFQNDLVIDTIKVLKRRWDKEPILFDKHGLRSRIVIDAVFNGEIFSPREI